ncbi:MAG TPA: hypothetical protein PK349_10320 [Candidatus Hydrogenedentes bacterium]|nr:hypothetical protein [Candidatus Hydrogenedentota bacterium]
MNARAWIAAMLIGCAAWWAAAAESDVLGLSSGETLSGTLVKITDGSVVFRTTMGGRLVAPVDRLTALSTRRGFMVTFSDGSTRYGRFCLDAEGKPALRLLDGASEGISLNQVSAAVPLPESPGTTPELSDGALAGSVGVGGGAGGVGGVDHGAVSGRLELGGNGPSLDWGVTVEGAARDRGDREVFRGLLQGDGEGFQPYLRSGYVRDALALDGQSSRRAYLGLGLYRSLFPESEAGSAAVYLGVGGVTDRYREPSGSGESSGTLTGGHLGLRLHRYLFGNTLLTHAGDLLADADGSAVALFTESALVRPLGDRLHLRLEFDADYTSGLSARDGWNFWWGAAIGMRF